MYRIKRLMHRIKRLRAPIIVRIAYFQIPATYDPNSSIPVKMTIYDFPYSPNHFKRGTWVRGAKRVGFQLYPLNENGLVTKEPITLRLFQGIPAKTNYDAMGAMKIIPAKPFFYYGTPVPPVQ